MKAFRPFFFIVAFVLMVGLACLGGPATKAPATESSAGQSSSSGQAASSGASNGAQSSKAASSSVAASSSGGSGGGQFFTDTFDSNSIDNYTIENRHKSADESKMDVSIKSGSMVFNLTGTGLYVYATYKPQTYDDVKISMTAENRGKNNNNVSLVCRQSSDGWYEFSIANNGLFWIYAYDATGTVSKGYNVIYNGGSLSIKQGKGTNTYTATCQGNKLTLEINGVLAKTISDNKYVFSSGQVGFSVSSLDVTPIVVNVNSFEVSQP